MGQKQTKKADGNNKKDQSNLYQELNLVGRNHFEFQYVIGKGGFGKVIIKNINRSGEFYIKRIKDNSL